MTVLSLEEQLRLNHLGLIPGPVESASDFATRATYCLSLKEHLSDELKTQLGPNSSDLQAQIKEPFNAICSRYDISPGWIPIFFSNYKLAPWHGGSAWIFQMSEKTPVAALLQLRRSLRTSDRYLKLYHRDELITHELSHVGRMMFEEPQFEEILAYRTSPSTFRRWFGPLVQSSAESMFFVLAIGLVVLVDFFLVLFYDASIYVAAMWLKIIPLVMLFLALTRLLLRQRSLRRCESNLSLSLKDHSHAPHVLYRLTDKEIKAFASMDPDKIKTYANAEAAKSLRWQLLLEAYF